MIFRVLLLTFRGLLVTCFQHLAAIVPHHLLHPRIHTHLHPRRQLRIQLPQRTRRQPPPNPPPPRPPRPPPHIPPPMRQHRLLKHLDRILGARTPRLFVERAHNDRVV